MDGEEGKQTRKQNPLALSLMPAEALSKSLAVIANISF